MSGSQLDPPDEQAEAARGELRLPEAMRALDQATTWVERPVRMLAGSARLNPLPHAGTISVFLLGVVTVTGLYITLFFEFGHVASYQAVASMEDHAIQRVVRALHRYASAALVLTTVIHAWRIFTAGRFVGGQRRWRWATGLAALILIWLAGVTGYWLIWDVRAQALNEIIIGLVGGTGFGVWLAVDHLGAVGGRSGSGFMLLLWFVHLLLTVVVGWFVFRHVRRTRLPWLPPAHWMAVMGVPLLLVSLAVPVGMLPAADPAGLVGDIPLDPFVLFLLPPLLSDMALVTLVVATALGALAFVVPTILQRRDPRPIVVSDDACTGCELCVIDCPYEALRMVGREGSWPALAVVDDARCVSCGICLGSCAFGAIELPGWDPNPAIDVAGRPLVVACERHLGGDLGPVDESAVIQGVSCAGALAPDALRLFTERGATSVQLVGCAPSECRYGIGNQLASERLTGDRRPHPAARFARGVSQDWVPAGRLGPAVLAPGAHPSVDGSKPPAGREAMVGAGLIAVATAVGVAFATGAPFRSEAHGPAVRIVVDHAEGLVLASDDQDVPLGSVSVVEVVIDGGTIAEHATAGGDGRWADIIDIELAPHLDGSDASSVRLEVFAGGDGGRTLVHTEAVDPAEERRILVDVTDRPPPPGVGEGMRIFTSRTGGCSVCHSVRPGDDGVGPSLAGVASVAGGRVEGLDAEQYLRQSILLPDQYVVEGWPAGQKLPIYRDRLSETELDAVVAYLMTLEAP